MTLVLTHLAEITLLESQVSMMERISTILVGEMPRAHKRKIGRHKQRIRMLKHKLKLKAPQVEK